MATPFTPPAEELPPLDALLALVNVDRGEIVDIAAELGWVFDRETDQFFDTQGNPVPFSDIRAELDRRIALADEEIDQLTVALFAGESTASEWEEGVVAILLLLLPMFFLFGKGAQRLTGDDLGFIEDRLRTQVGYLRNFTRDVLDGELSREQIRARQRLYTQDDSLAFEEAWDRLHDVGDYPWYRNVLGGCSHCQGCPNETAKGYVRRGQLVPIGMRPCLWNCCCHYEYSDSRERPTDSIKLGETTWGFVGAGSTNILRML